MAAPAIAAKVIIAIAFWGAIAHPRPFELVDDCMRSLPCASVVVGSLQPNQLGNTYCVPGACDVIVVADAPEATYVHELGHVLGLRHVAESRDIMRPSLGGLCITQETANAGLALGFVLRRECMPVQWLRP